MRLLRIKILICFILVVPTLTNNSVSYADVSITTNCGDATVIDNQKGVNPDPDLLIGQAEDIWENYKTAFRTKVAKRFYGRDKGEYNRILNPVRGLLDSVKDNQCKGGNLRIIVAMDIIQKLVHIHKNEVYGSEEKREKLRDLLKYTHKNVARVDRLPKKRVHLEVLPSSWDQYYPEVQGFFAILFSQAERAPTVGVNLHILFNQFGFSFGRIRTLTGSRRAIAGFNGGVCPIPCVGATAQYSEVIPNTAEIRALEAAGLIVGFGCSMGRKDGAGYLGLTKYDDLMPVSYEAGVLIGGLIMSSESARNRDGFGGIGATVPVKLFRLPCDLKYFREKIGLLPESGKLPCSLQQSIDDARTEQDLSQTAIEYGGQS